MNISAAALADTDPAHLEGRLAEMYRHLAALAASSARQAAAEHRNLLAELEAIGDRLRAQRHLRDVQGDVPRD